MSGDQKDCQDAAPLTRNQSLVLGVLTRTDGPLSAYAILDALRGDGFRAPLQVYRALEKLQGDGRVHRIESLNAYVACQHRHVEAHETIAFTICDQCGDVRELEDVAIGDDLKRLTGEVNFALRTSVVELRGLCSECTA